MKPIPLNYWSDLRKKSLTKNPIKRSPLVRKPTVIRKVSDKRAKELRVYERAKAEYFEEHSTCEFPGCEVENVTLHHMVGRIGDRLTNKEYFKSLCWVHHQWVEENPEEAKAMGLSFDRL